MGKKLDRSVVLGNTVRDRVSGTTGIAIVKTELLNGTIQLSIQTKVNNRTPEKFPDAYSHDIQMLEYIDAGVSDKVTQSPGNVHVNLGDLVEDVVIGTKGIAVQKHTYINGCVFFSIQPKMLEEKDEIPKLVNLSYDRLVILERNAFKPTVEEANIRTGGPSTPSIRIC